MPQLPFEESDWRIFFQGAESRVYRGVYGGKKAILKERFEKKYRLPELDRKLTKDRIRCEQKAYEKVSKRCKPLSEQMPKIYYADERNIIFEDLCDTDSVCVYFSEHQDRPELIERILTKLGVIVAQIHSCGIIHGDLTTSNFLVCKQKDTEDISVIPIDFGLSFSSTTDEDRAVDLYVLERAIQSTHPGLSFETFLKSYQAKMETDKINKRLDQVRMRGRKRLMIG